MHMRTRIGSSVLALGLLVGGFASAQLNGSYTIDPLGSGPRNFTTISAAIQALTAGVCGPVVFDLAPVVFPEALLVQPVPGASASCPITFRAVGAPATIDPGSSSGSNTLLMLNGASWFRFVNLRMQSWTQTCIRLLGVASGSGVHDNVFDRVVCDTPTTPNQFIHAFTMTGGKNNRFQGCIFRGGSYTVRIEYSTSNVLDGCEMDGKSRANNVVCFWNTNDADNVLQNCFVHDPEKTYGTAIHSRSAQYGNMIFNNTVLCNTAGWAVQMGGICQSWDKACGFKNNILINLGTGRLVEYDFCDHPPQPSNTLVPCVSDYNDYCCPRNPNYLRVIGGYPISTVFEGNLSAFQAWQQTTPSPVWPGGPTSYDAHSVEADPCLVRMSAPFDIRLAAGSPLIDRGTSHFVESYQSFNPNHQVSADFEGQARDARVDIGCDEAAATIIGSGTPRPGGTVVLDLFHAGDAGLPFQVGSSFGQGPIPLGAHVLCLDLDALLDISVNGYWPTCFPGTGASWMPRARPGRDSYSQHQGACRPHHLLGVSHRASRAPSAREVGVQHVLVPDRPLILRCRRCAAPRKIVRFCEDAKALIGIGGNLTIPPSHTTGHTGPYHGGSAG